MSWHLRLRDELRGMANWLLPPACAACDHPLTGDSPLCTSCLAQLPKLTAARCPICALPYPVNETGSHLCGDCTTSKPPFSTVHALGRYEGFLRELIQRFKYHRLPTLDGPLGQLLAEELAKDPAPENFDGIVPVPLHPERLRQRTFNQSLLIARSISRHLGPPVDHHLLKRVRTTQAQQRLNALERQKNLKDSFEANGDIEGLRLLLVDDVMTTGATARNCAATLLAAGAAEVRVTVLARATRYLVGH